MRLNRVFVVGGLWGAAVFMGCTAKHVYASSGKNELILHYRSFAPDAGGFQAIGGHWRFNRFLLSAHAISGGLEASVAYVYRPDAGALQPRFGFGAGYYYTLSLVVNSGITLKLFKLFGGQIGLALDQWIYFWPANRFQMTPWTIVGLSYAYG